MCFTGINWKIVSTYEPEINYLYHRYRCTGPISRSGARGVERGCRGEGKAQRALRLSNSPSRRPPPPLPARGRSGRSAALQRLRVAGNPGPALPALLLEPRR
eukprot:8560332-Pyramimonas_sp.AAC.2